MFKIYDLNMKEIPFPDGVIPLEIFVGSVGKERTVDTVDGRAGVVDYGFNYTDRPVSLFLRIKAADKTDFRLLRNEVFATFDVGSAFYVAESDVPSRVLKVVVDESYIPERLTEEYADFDINCRTLVSVFWESKYTTLELHDSGYDATAEKYGLVDNIDDEKVQYRFTPEILIQNVGANAFKNGFLSSTNGQESDSSTNLIITSYVNVVIGNTYKFVDEGWSSAVQYWWIYEYDDNNKFIKSHSFSNKEFDFVPVGKKLKFMAQPYNDNTLKASDVGVSGSGKSIIPLLKRPSTVNTFSVYNAGNVTVEPESMYLDIVFADTRGDSITVKNKTTGEVLEINAKTTGHVVRQQGMVIYVGGINRFRDTNRRFIRLLPGINEFEVTGSSYGRVSVDFKFYYK